MSLQDDDRYMSSFRRPLEWAFGEEGMGLKQLWKALSEARLMGTRQRPLGSYLLSGVLIRNAILCDKPEMNQIMHYFGDKMPTPSLTDYFNVAGED